MDALTGSELWKEYMSTWLPHNNNVSWPVLLSYTFLFLGLYWLLSSLWAYFQIITRNTPPGPTPMPFMGNFGFMLMPGWLLQLLQYGMDSSKLSKVPAGSTRRGAFLYPHIVLTNMAKMYGKIYGLFIGTRLIVILNDFDTVKDAMVNHSEVFSDRPSVPLVNIITKRKGRIMEYYRSLENFLYIELWYLHFAKVIIVNVVLSCYISNMHLIDH